jgi:toxin FitB
LISLLDTDVVSQRMKAAPNQSVMLWMGSVPKEKIFLSVTTILEIRTGIELMPAGRKQREMESWLANDINQNYAGRILPITAEIADMCGRLVARRRKASETPGINDCLLAATALVHGLSVATLNRKHFEKLGVELVEF